MIRLNLSFDRTAYYRQTANELARRLRMRKRLFLRFRTTAYLLNGASWILTNLGMVEITSEDEAHPIECALQLSERGLALLRRDLRSSDSSSTSHKTSNAFAWFSKRLKPSAHKSSS